MRDKGNYNAFRIGQKSPDPALRSGPEQISSTPHDLLSPAIPQQQGRKPASSRPPARAVTAPIPRTTARPVSAPTHSAGKQPRNPRLHRSKQAGQHSPDPSLHTTQSRPVPRQPFLPDASIDFAALTPSLTVDSALHRYDNL